MKRARRLQQLPPYPFARWEQEVARVRKAGTDVIRLDIGNPDLPPPDAVIEALYRSAQVPTHHGYSGYRGLPELRRAIADYYAQRFGVRLDPETEVLPLIGSKEGIVNLALAVLDPGDVVLVPDPGYAPYAMGALLAGAEVVTFPLLPERGFLPDLDAIPEETAARAQILWLNYPNNPTGAVVDADFLEQAVSFARRHKLLLAFDAPYADVTYGDYISPSILQVPGAAEVALEFNSLSKTYNMAGWRVGMAVGQREALTALAQVKSNVDSGMFHPLQAAAIVALTTEPGWIEARNRVYAQRLELMATALTRLLGLPLRLPRAGLYLWAPTPADTSSESFSRLLLEQAGVAVAPGSFFGPAGEGYVRFSATAPTAQIETAMARIARALGGN